MFYQILRSFLGPFTIILDFFATRPEWVTVFFSLYLGLYALGRLQLFGIRKRTHQLIEERCKEWLAAQPKASAKELYRRFYPIWETELSKWRYFFILNKYDLLPVSVTPKHVLVKIPLSPEYLHQYLEEIGLMKTQQNG